MKVPRKKNKQARFCVRAAAECAYSVQWLIGGVAIVPGVTFTPVSRSARSNSAAEEWMCAGSDDQSTRLWNCGAS